MKKTNGPETPAEQNSPNNKRHRTANGASGIGVSPGLRGGKILGMEIADSDGTFAIPWYMMFEREKRSRTVDVLMSRRGRLKDSPSWSPAMVAVSVPTSTMSAPSAAAVQPVRPAGGAKPKAAPASPEQLETVKRLVQIIARLFYDDGPVLVVDQLVGTNVVPSDVLARRLGLQTRDLASLAAKLVEDKIVYIYRSQDMRDGVLNRAFACVATNEEKCTIILTTRSSLTSSSGA